MERRAFLRTAAWAGVSGATLPLCAQQAAEMNTGLTEAQRRIRHAAAAALAMQRRDWEQGILAQAFLEAGEREQVILLTKAAMVQATPDGRMGVVVNGSPTDPAMGGVAYAQAAVWTGDREMRQAVDKMLEWIRIHAPRNKDGILYHVFEGKEMWSDGFNGAPPFLAAMGFCDEALRQIEGFRVRLWNPRAKLLAHIWDDDKGKLKDARFWGGGNGWAAAGLARVIRSLPAERSADREQLAGFLREILDGCLAHQREDGLFHDVVDQGDTFVETNLAQMLAFAMYQGVRGGWLPAEYQAKADGMRAAARDKMDAFGYVQGVCGAPGFDKPGTSAEGQAFCMMMEAGGGRQLTDNS